MMSVAGISRSVARGWLADDRPLALATLVETIGSTPLEAGSIISARNRRSADPLKDTDDSIHA